jgi:DNA-binding NtrC family response regulator
MRLYKKKILIIDEAGFSRICSAILENEGFGTDIIPDVHQFDSWVDFSDIGLVITSYPYGASMLEKLKKWKIPTIILSDHMSLELMATLDHFDKSLSYCMLKPLDYQKFRSLVSETMNKSEQSFLS